MWLNAQEMPHEFVEMRRKVWRIHFLIMNVQNCSRDLKKSFNFGFDTNKSDNIIFESLRESSAVNIQLKFFMGHMITSLDENK